MTDLRETAASFDARAGSYSRNQWHRQYAERLVELTPLEPNQTVLDAGTGTGFAAIAIARRVAPDGRVLAVDISPAMLDAARLAVESEGIRSVELVRGDAANLPEIASGTLDAIVCAAALLYMNTEAALREWHRLLRPAGVVAFSTMREGSPPGGRLFRECARAAGVELRDPSAGLGTEKRAGAALAAAGFQSPRIVAGMIEMSDADLALAWESNVHSAAHAGVRMLNDAAQARLRQTYEVAMARALADDPAAIRRAEVLYAIATK